MNKYKIRCWDGMTATVKGTTHKLILKNGEKVSVIVHRPCGSDDKYWCVSDRETGLQICGTKEYNSFICDNYFCGLDTKEQVLLTAVSKLNVYLCENGKTFAEFKQKRLEEINYVEKGRRKNI